MLTRLSPIRRFLMWWLRHPNSPYVSANFAVDFTAAGAYLDALNARGGARVSVHHLFSAAVARTWAAFPVANARVLGNSIRREKHVGIAAPVSLLGHDGEESRELSLMVLKRAEEKTLLELAEATRETVKTERTGQATFPLARLLLSAANLAPDTALFPVMDRLWEVLSDPRLGPVTARLIPVTVAVSNPGAALADTGGVWWRGGAFNLPGPGWMVGSMFGLTPVQDEVVPVDGVPAVRPVLPVLFIFDHRLFDGVMAGRIIHHLCDILKDPAATFGEAGDRPGRVRLGPMPPRVVRDRAAAK